MANVMTPSSPVSVLHGVGDARARAFARMGIHTLSDLLYHFPRAYENRGDICLLSAGLDGEKHAFILTVATEPKTALIRRGMQITRFRAFDASGTAEIVFFNQPYVKELFHVGGEFRFFGAVTATRGGCQLSSPIYEAILKDRPLADFVPIYPLCEGLTNKAVSAAVEGAIRALLPTLADHLPNEICRKEGLASLSFALKNIHAPENEETLKKALNRMIFDELFCFSVGMGLAQKKDTRPSAFPCPPCDVTPLLSRLPYELTPAQKRVVTEIRQDMAGGKTPPMSRILVGDVGCGKTVCAAIALYTAVKAGYQGALMAPTEILARQHYADLRDLFSSLGIRVALLVGSTPEKEKKAIRASLLSSGGDRIDLLIGTHALLSDKLRFSSLALTVTDEQHRFGVAQRAALKEKGEGSHLLVMSATPIPRTLALTLYGDLAISRIDEMPKGRQRVSTYVVGEEYRARLNGFIRKQVEEGGQVYIVCPAVEESEEEIGEIALDRFSFTNLLREETPPLKAATAYAKELQETVFPDLRVAFLHGQMKTQEKADVMAAFVAGEIDILVSTTVIEVGVNVPRASLMIVENAERFGLSQLHQLRGRVGRGTRKSYCVLVSDAKGESAKARLETMRTTYDGYTIAEADLAQRGPGDFFALTTDGELRQSGGLSLRLTRLCSDQTQMERAARDAKDLLKKDPTLSLPDDVLLGDTVKRLFRIRENTLS